MAVGGKRAGAGRPKGSLDKNNKQLREMILEALERNGGVDYLAAQAVAEPKAFLSLLARVLPMQVTGEGGGPVETVTSFKLVPMK
jgi:molybdopterin-guanine dinucleotide biosynthesis protein A